MRLRSVGSRVHMRGICALKGADPAGVVGTLRLPYVELDVDGTDNCKLRHHLTIQYRKPGKHRWRTGIVRMAG